jgi:hypothetical protein
MLRLFLCDFQCMTLLLTDPLPAGFPGSREVRNSYVDFIIFIFIFIILSVHHARNLLKARC